MSVLYSFTVLALLTGFIANESVVPKHEKLFSSSQEVKQQQQQLRTSALYTALAFELHHDLATRTTAEPYVQQQKQHNISLLDLGPVSAPALLSQASGSESWIQALEALEALGLAANSTELSVEATISALADQ